MKSYLSISKTVYLVLIFYFSDDVNALANFTLTKIKMLPSVEKTSNITTTEHSSFLGKFFGKKSTIPNIKKNQKSTESIYDIIKKPARLKRLTNDNPFSDFTQPYNYKKSTLPIIMDTTTSTNGGKKHVGYADVQSKTTMMAISPKMSKNRSKFKTFLNKILHKKQKEKQKRDALINLHREIRFSPFKKLKEMFQASSSKPPTTLIPPFTKKVLFNKENTNDEMEKITPNRFENDLPQKDNTMTTYNFQATNIFPSEDFGGFKIENNPRQNNWKPHKDYLESQLKSEEIATNYPTLKYSPIYFKQGGPFENTEPKNKIISPYNKYRNKIHQLTGDDKMNDHFGFGFKFDSSDLPPVINPFTLSHSDTKKHPNAKNGIYDPNIKFESFANFDLIGKFETSATYGQTNTLYANNIEDPKYDNSDNTEPKKLESINHGYSVSSNPFWQLKDSHEMENKLDESRMHSKDDTGKLTIKLS